MYGNSMVSGSAGASLASTGLAVGSIALLILGGIFTLVGVFVLLRKNSKDRP